MAQETHIAPSKALLLAHIHVFIVTICVDALEVVRESQLEPSIDFLEAKVQRVPQTMLRSGPFPTEDTGLIERNVRNAELHETNGILQVGARLAVQVVDMHPDHGKVCDNVECLWIVPLRASVVVDGVRGVLESVINVNLHEAVWLISSEHTPICCQHECQHEHPPLATILNHMPGFLCTFRSC